MNYEEWVKQRKAAATPVGTTPSYSDTNPASTPELGSYETWAQKRRAENAKNDVNSWLDSSVNLLNRYSTLASSYHTSDAYKAFNDERDRLLLSAIDYQDQYRGNSEALDTINNVVKALSNASTGKAESYWSQWESKEDYDKAVQGYKDYQAMATFDTQKGAKDIETLEKIIGESLKYGLDENNRKSLEAQLRGLGYSSYEEAKKKLADDKAYLTRATRLQEQLNREQQAKTAADFETASAAGKAMTDDQIINLRTNGNWKNQTWWYEKAGLPWEYTPYYAAKHMTDDEFNVYSYYLGKGDRESAEAYINGLQDSINAREANTDFKKIEGKPLAELAFGVRAGFDQFRSGLMGWGSDGEYVAPSTTQYISQMAREDIGKSDQKFLGATIGQGTYDFITTGTNMIPSILASTGVTILTGNPVAGQLTGAALMGASAGGHAYQEMVNLGYDKENARMYGELIALSEGGLQYLLGGIGKLGGKLTGHMIGNALAKIDGAFFKFAAKYGLEMASEGFEEGLQDIIEPLLKNAIFDTDETVDWEQVAYSALLGALSAGGMNAIGGGVDALTRNFENGYYGGAYRDVVADLVDEALEINPANKLAIRMKEQLDSGKSVSDRNIRRIVQGNETTLYENDQGAIRQAVIQQLRERGETRNVEALADVIEKSVRGEQLTYAERRALNQNETASTIADELHPLRSNPPSWVRQIRTDRINPETYNPVENTGNGSLRWTENQQPNPISQMSQARNAAQITSVEMPTLAETGNEAADSLIQKANTGAVSVDDAQAILGNAEAVQALQKAVGKLELEGKTEAEQAETIRKAVADYTDQYKQKAEAARQATQANRAVPQNVETVAQKYGKQAGAIRSIYNVSPTQDIEGFANGVEVAYRLGYDGGLEADAVNSPATQVLSETQRRLAYATGKSVRAAENETRRGNTNREGSVRAVGVKVSGNPYMRKGVQIVRAFSRMTGTTIELYNSNGKSPSQGSYNNKTDVIRLDVSAGINSEADLKNFTKYAMLRVFGHEFTHFGEKWAPAEYNILATTVAEVLSAKEGFDLESRIREVQAAYKKYENQDLSWQGALDEIVAEGMTDVLPESQFFDRLLEKSPTVANKLLNSLKQFVSRLKAIIREYFGGLAGNLSPDADALRVEVNDQIKYLDGIVDKWDAMALAAVENYNNAPIVPQNEHEGSITPASGDLSFSIRENESITERSIKYFNSHRSQSAHISEEAFNAANDIVNEMAEYMKPFLDISNNQGRRYLPEEILGKTTFNNGSYGRTIENTTICFRTLAYIDFTNEIKKRIGRPLTVEESFLASQMLYDIAKEPQCLYCYVSLDRKAYDGFLLEYIKQRDSVIDKYNALEDKSKAAIDGLYKEFLDGRKDTRQMRNRFDLWINTAARGEQMITNADLTTEEVRSEIKNRKDNLARQMIDAERYAQSASWAKKLEQYRSYNGDILSMSQNMVDTLNKHYGLRFYSFSEYTPAFIVENMQQIRDASIKGLYGLAYTKKPDFARIFAKTGMNINISVFGRMDHGQVVPDTLQGADWGEVQQLRKQYKNVGAVFVATNDAMTEWALAQDWIDVVIPFHIVRTGANVAEFYKWVNNTREQADLDASGKNKTITPAEFHNDKETFLRLIKERGLTPRFAKWINNENYMKLVNETRLSDLESEKLHPMFDLDAAKASFDAFVEDGGYYGNWYEEGIDYDESVETVANDIREGRRANEVEYGRQDFDASVAMRNRSNRQHGQEVRSQPADTKENVQYALRDYNSMTYAELTEEQRQLTQRENEISERKKAANNSTEYIDAVTEYMNLVDEAKELLDKRKRGESTPEENERINALRDLRKAASQRIEDVSEKLGLTRLVEEEREIRNEREALRLAADEAWEREGAEKENAAIEKSGLSAPEYFRRKALRAFKTTTNFNEAGYLLPDGRMLNFSGGERNHRYRDHREIGEIYEATSGTAALNRFLNDGNIRVMAESPGIDLAAGVEPTREQYAAIRKFINTIGSQEKQFYIDFSNTDGSRANNLSYDGNVNAGDILNDIKRFYQSGGAQQRSELMQFHVQYAIRPDAPDKIHRAATDIHYDEEITLTDTTPSLMLGHKGVRNLPLVMKSSHMRENILTADEAAALGLTITPNDDYHGLGEELFKEIIDSLDDVTYGYRGTKNAKNPGRREKYFVLLPQIIDKDGNKIMVPVYINEQRNKNIVNILATVFGKTNLDDYLRREVQNGNLVRIKRKGPNSIDPKAPIAGGLTAVAFAKEAADQTAMASYAPNITQDNAGRQEGNENFSNEQKSLRTLTYTNRELLEMAANDVSIMGGLTQADRSALEIFKNRLDKLRGFEEQQAEQRRKLQELNTAATPDRDEITKTQNRINLLGRKISAAENLVLDVENKQTLKKVLQHARNLAVNQVRRNERALLQERSDVTKYRERVQEKAKRLSDMILKNSDKEHVPAALRGPLADFVASIGFDSRRKMSGGPDTKRDIKYTEALDRLRQIVQNQADYMANPENGSSLDFYLDLPEDFSLLIQEHLNQVTEAVKAFGAEDNNQVFAMDSNELKRLDQILTIINHSVSQINNLHTEGRFSGIAQAGQNTILAMNERRAFTRSKRAAAISGFFEWKNALPYYAFKRYGEAGKEIFHGIQRGWEKFAFNTNDLIAFTETAYETEEQQAWSNELHKIEMEDGRTMQMTTAQIMSLYCLNKREQARGHILGGGVRVGNIEAKQGRRKQTVTQTEPFNMTPDDVKKITDMLTDRQRAVADALQEYMNTVGTKWGNEVSMARFGYEGFGEKNYFPIESDQTNLPAKDPDAKANDLFRLLNMSMTKALTPKANNALVVSNIFQVFANHMSDMAKYNALALPVLDAMKWINYKESTGKNENGQFKTLTVQRAIEEAYGQEGMSYFMNFMKDLNGKNNGGRDENGLLARGMSAYKVAAVAANLRVALLQTTAYFRASAVLKPSDMARAVTMNRKQAREERMKYSGISVWKDLGFYDTNIGRNVEDLIMHNETIRDKIADKALWLAEKGDAVTWDVIWNACKLDQQKKGLNGEELMEATAERFMEVIYRTQVVDSTLTRTQLMRDKSIAIKNITGFMSEPGMSYNLLLDAYEEFNTVAQKEGKAQAWKDTSGKVWRALGAYAASQLVAAIVESIADAARDDDDYESYLDKWLQAFLGDESFLKGNLYSDMSISAKVPLLKMIPSYLQGYETTDMVTQGLKDLFELPDFLKSQSRPDYGKIYKVAQVASRLGGVPIGNAMREFATIWNNTVGVITGQKLKTYTPNDKTVIKEAYEGGKLTEQKAIDELVRRGGMEEKDAKAQVTKWKYSEWDTNGGGLSQDEVAIGLESGNFTEKEKQQIWQDMGFKKDLTPKVQAKAQVELDENARIYNSTNWKEGMQDRSLSNADKDRLVTAYGGYYVQSYTSLRSAGYSPAEAIRLLTAIDADGNGSVKQAEAYAYLQGKSDQQALPIWNSFGWSTSWEKYKARQH